MFRPTTYLLSSTKNTGHPACRSKEYFWNNKSNSRRHSYFYGRDTGLISTQSFSIKQKHLWHSCCEWVYLTIIHCSTDLYFRRFFYISMHQTQDKYNSLMLVLLINFPFPAQNILLSMPGYSSITEISKNIELWSFRLANEPILWPKWDSNLFRAVKLSISRGIRDGSKTQYRPINPLRSTLIVLMCRHLRTRKGG